MLDHCATIDARWSISPRDADAASFINHPKSLFFPLSFCLREAVFKLLVPPVFRFFARKCLGRLGPRISIFEVVLTIDLVLLRSLRCSLVVVVAGEDHVLSLILRPRRFLGLCTLRFGLTPLRFVSRYSLWVEYLA